MPGFKKLNNYVHAVDDLYAQAPKAVWAAIAVSFGTMGGDRLDDARKIVLREWRVLHGNGVVPQKPPKEAYAIPLDEE